MLLPPLTELSPPLPSPRKSKTSSQVADWKHAKNSVTAAALTPVMADSHSDAHMLVSAGVASRHEPALWQKSPQGLATPAVTGKGLVQTGICGISMSTLPPGVPGAGVGHCEPASGFGTQGACAPLLPPPTSVVALSFARDAEVA